MNQRQKGKVGERFFAKILRAVFPDVQRNAGTQAREGGSDLINTSPFNFEVKYGKAYNSKMIRGMLDQVKKEGDKANWDVVLVKPDREKAYVVMPFEDFMEILENMHAEEIF